MAKKRKKRTDEELRSISNHLIYEFQMLQRTCEFARTEDNALRRNAFIESSTIHARNLLDFLYSPHSLQDDDVIAEDFFDVPSVWLQNQPKMSLLLKSARRRVGKEIAHLTYERLLKKDKKWQNSAIVNEIREVVLRFRGLAPQNRLGDKVEKFFARKNESANKIFETSSHTSSDML